MTNKGVAMAEIQDFGVGLLAIAGAAWGVMRLMREFGRSDAADAKQSGLVEIYRKHAEEANARERSLLAEIDRIQKERNDAVRDLGRLEAQVSNLTQQVESLRDENRLLRAKVDEQADLMHGMSEATQMLLQELKRLKP